MASRSTHFVETASAHARDEHGAAFKVSLAHIACVQRQDQPNAPPGQGERS